MDLIYADKNRKDIGVLQHYNLDLEQSLEKGNNTFQVKNAMSTNVLDLGNYVYIEGTEYGGRIDSYKLDTAQKVIAHSGRTWRGILEGKIIEPDTGSAYLTLSGDANEILGTLINRVSLSDLFVAKSGASGFEISGFQFDRYTDLYSGIIKMLTKAGAKLHIEWLSGKVVISAIAIDDYSNQSGITSDLFDFTIQKTINTVNHLIGLGSGELTERQVIHKYIGADGNVQDEQFYTGLNEVMDTYINTNCESIEELEEKTEEELLNRYVADGVKITANDIAADIGDRVTVQEENMKDSVTQYVTNKIIVIESDEIKINYEVGEIL